MTPETTTIGASELLSLGGSLVVIVVAIVALGWLYSRSRSLGGSSNDVISVVASRALGTRERLMLVEVADQQLLIGMTATQVQTLHVFDKPVVTGVAAAPAVGFASRLKAAIIEGNR